MNNGFKTFFEVISAVKTATGITNLNNRFNEIRNLISRAETEINPYGGYLIKKKMLLFKNNGVFNGSSIKKPFDFVSIDKVGSCDDGLCPGDYFETESHIVLCGESVKNKESIVYTYWALHFDKDGNPMITTNHFEAIVAFIVWQMYSAKVFLGTGSRANKIDYQLEFEMRCQEARGEDFMTLNYNEIYKTNLMSSYDMYLKSRKDICLCESSCMFTEEESENENLNIMNVYYFQHESYADTIESILPLINQEFINEIETKQLFSIFEQGYKVLLSTFGKLCFIIQYTNLDNYEIYDSLNNDVTDQFEINYIDSLRAALFVSKIPYTHSLIYFKFKKTNTINLN